LYRFQTGLVFTHFLVVPFGNSAVSIGQPLYLIMFLKCSRLGDQIAIIYRGGLLVLCNMSELRQMVSLLGSCFDDIFLKFAETKDLKVPEALVK